MTLRYEKTCKRVLNGRNIPREMHKSCSVKFIKAHVTHSVPLNRSKKKEHPSAREEKWHFAQQKTCFVLPRSLFIFPFFSIPILALFLSHSLTLSLSLSLSLSLLGLLVPFFQTRIRSRITKDSHRRAFELVLSRCFVHPRCLSYLHASSSSFGRVSLASSPLVDTRNVTREKIEDGTRYAKTMPQGNCSHPENQTNWTERCSFYATYTHVQFYPVGSYPEHQALFTEQ